MARRPAPGLAVGGVHLVGAGSRYRGSLLAVDGDLRVDGEVFARVRATGRVVVSEHGRVEGGLVARDVRCAGTLRGDVGARSLVLLPTARFDGEATVARLRVADGVTGAAGFRVRPDAGPSPEAPDAAPAARRPAAPRHEAPTTELPTAEAPTAEAPPLDEALALPPVLDPSIEPAPIDPAAIDPVPVDPARVERPDADRGDGAADGREAVLGPFVARPARAQPARPATAPRRTHASEVPDRLW